MKNNNSNKFPQYFRLTKHNDFVTTILQNCTLSRNTNYWQEWFLPEESQLLQGMTSTLLQKPFGHKTVVPDLLQ